MLHYYFNSIKVRLEQILQGVTKGLDIYFNSIKVRLEPYFWHKTVPSRNEFQFHKGAIRTSLASLRCSRLLTFQFHKGAIRTSRTMIMSTSISYFNSIKVRLEPGARPHWGRAHGNFNSIKVRLEPESATMSPYDYRFQFHKGAIRTMRNIKPHFATLLYFNSIKVRLELLNVLA